MSNTGSRLPSSTPPTALHRAGRAAPAPEKGTNFTLAALAGDTEHPLLVVELPHQVNDEVALLAKARYALFEHIPAQLAARLLQGGNGRLAAVTPPAVPPWVISRLPLISFSSSIRLLR